MTHKRRQPKKFRQPPKWRQINENDIKEEEDYKSEDHPKKEEDPKKTALKTTTKKGEGKQKDFPIKKTYSLKVDQGAILE